MVSRPIIDRRPARRRGRKTGPPQGGFTLMEVLVALSVVAIALMAIYRMHSQTLFMDTRSRFDSVATMLTRQKLADVNAIELSEFNADDGDFGQDHPGYSWKIQTEAVTSDLIRQDGPTLKQIRLTISHNETAAEFTLTTYRFANE
jgi:general secretion pathway protein I